MKSSKIFINLAFFILISAVCACSVERTENIPPKPKMTQMTPEPNLASLMPAYQSEESAKNLPATLSPDMFKGETKAAYAAVKEMPEVIAQLPCYCRCDRAMGHKSLHTCYVDDHASQCGVCMNSALKAYKLRKEKKMSVAQIREQLTAEYGK